MALSKPLEPLEPLASPCRMRVWDARATVPQRPPRPSPPSAASPPPPAPEGCSARPAPASACARASLG